MTKPLGYYCNVNPGNGSFLDYLQEEYGSTFEKLSKLQKLYILSSLIGNLTETQIKLIGNYQASEEMNAIAQKIGEIKQNLKIGDHLSLADAVINQLKSHR